MARWESKARGLVDVDDAAEPLVLVLGRVDGLRDVPRDGAAASRVVA